MARSVLDRWGTAARTGGRWTVQPRVRVGAALDLVGLVYLVGFGQGVVDAVGSLLGTEGPGPAVDGAPVAVSGSVAQLGSAAGLVDAVPGRGCIEPSGAG